MPAVNPRILLWARQTARLSEEEAVHKLAIGDARGATALDRLNALERGEKEPTRTMLAKMAKQYRRPLVTFYLSEPPRKGDRGHDFRHLPADHPPVADALLDALIRDVRARQSLVRSALEDEEDATRLPFVDSARTGDGIATLLRSIRETIRVDLRNFRDQRTPEEAFTLLRNAVETVGVFVLLIGDLGSHHTAFDLETFRGFTLADPIAPFIVINDHDSKPAWAFTLLHELAHLWLGETGVSGLWAESDVERFCNDVAGEFLLPAHELEAANITANMAFDDMTRRIMDFAVARHLSFSMVAYKLYRTGIIPMERWRALSAAFREMWLLSRAGRRERSVGEEGGPNYYIVRRHRLGTALLDLVRRSMSAGVLTPSQAGKVLGVKPRNVQPLLDPAMQAGRGAAG